MIHYAALRRALERRRSQGSGILHTPQIRHCLQLRLSVFIFPHKPAYLTFSFPINTYFPTVLLSYFLEFLLIRLLTLSLFHPSNPTICAPPLTKKPAPYYTNLVNHNQRHVRPVPEHWLLSSPTALWPATVRKQRP